MDKVIKLSVLNHINYPDKDEFIYCRFMNDLLYLDKQGKYFQEHCLKCPLFNGDYQGDGVECIWHDMPDAVTYCSHAEEELVRVNRMIKQGILKKNSY